MSEFFNVLPPQLALDMLKRHLDHSIGRETISTSDALGRVTAIDIVSPENLPVHPRSAMDGYSVRAQDTFGATETMPAYFEIMGEVPMGRAPGVTIGTGEAAIAYTGGLLAGGTDAVVIVEHTQQIDETTLEVMRPIAPGENVIQSGEDVQLGEPVLEAGHIIRPQDIGGLLALGLTEVTVSKKPRVAIVSTGDELIVPDQMPGPGQIRDINSYTIAALVARGGGFPVHTDLVPDDLDIQCAAARHAIDNSDLLVFSAGSSVSSRDLTSRVLNELGTPGVLVHGISHKPGKPTILAVANGKAAFGLPGNPVSAMIVFDLLIRPIIYWLSGCDIPPTPNISARLTQDIASISGREDYVPVRLTCIDGKLYANPIFGKSNLIYTLVKATGTVCVPLNKGGLYAGDEITVTLY